MKRLVLVALGVLVLGCASDESDCGPGDSSAAAKAASSSQDGGGSLWDQLDRAAREKKKRGTVASTNEAAAKALPEGWRQKIDGWWGLYQKDDAQWPAAKAEWLGMSDPAPTILVENLLRAYVLAWDAGQRAGFERARDELLAIPQHTLPILVIGLSRGSGDSVVRNLSEDLLGAAGDQAVAPIEGAWAAATPKGKTSLARALRKMKSPGATPALSRIARSRSEDFQPRIEAIQGLGESKDPAGFETVVSCLSDPDRSVRKFAAASLGGFGRQEAVPMLKSAAQQAQNRGEADVAEAAAASLKTLGATP